MIEFYVKRYCIELELLVDKRIYMYIVCVRMICIYLMIYLFQSFIRVVCLDMIISVFFWL